MNDHLGISFSSPQFWQKRRMESSRDAHVRLQKYTRTLSNDEKVSTRSRHRWNSRMKSWKKSSGRNWKRRWTKSWRSHLQVWFSNDSAINLLIRASDNVHSTFVGIYPWDQSWPREPMGLFQRQFYNFGANHFKALSFWRQPRAIYFRAIPLWRQQDIRKSWQKQHLAIATTRGKIPIIPSIVIFSLFHPV